MGGMHANRYKWLVVAMLWWVCLFNYADRQAIFSVFPLLQKEMGLSDFQLGIVGSSFMWVYALALPLAGLVGDRWPRRTLILSGLMFWSLITLLTALATEYWHLVVCRALEGFGEAFYFPASMSLISAYHDGRTRSRAMSLHQSSVYAGTIVGGAVAGWLAEEFGWRCGFFVFGGLGVVLGLVLWQLLREPPRAGLTAESPFRRRDIGAALADVLRLPRVWLLIAVFIGANFVAMVFLTWMPTYLHKTFHMDLALSGLSATAYLQVASVLGVLAGGWLADRLARRLARGRMLTQAGGLLLGVPFIFLTGWTLSVPVLVCAMTGFGFFKGVYDANIWASLYDEVPVERRATALGVMNSLGWLVGSSGPVLIALAAEQWSMGACLSATAAIYLVFGLVLGAGMWAGRLRPGTTDTPRIEEPSCQSI
jgi:MFS family permease